MLISLECFLRWVYMCIAEGEGGSLSKLFRFELFVAAVGSWLWMCLLIVVLEGRGESYLYNVVMLFVSLVLEEEVG